MNPWSSSIRATNDTSYVIGILIRNKRMRRGITLIELLIVVAVIGLLLQLALPAVQMARESARRVSCVNNLRQIAMGCQLHLTSQKHFPSGGWGYAWVGEPERGFGHRQPGGWAYNILPFIEESTVHDMAAGQAGEAKAELLRKMVRTPISIFICPSRRLVQPYPDTLHNYTNAGNPIFGGKTDYAGCVGAEEKPEDQPGPTTIEDGDKWAEGPKEDRQWVAGRLSGVIFQRSLVEPRHILDGTSNTYLVGEKFLDPMHYESGVDWGDDQHLYLGFDKDLCRSAHQRFPPQQDEICHATNCDRRDWTGHEKAYGGFWQFGSAHSAGLNMAFCDGSVQLVGYAIDPIVHEQFGKRSDEQVVTR
jgi:prepilin-type N-terminal cleavage/methylation domain-containing protein/prepilin-type processing-associated H-X9-DG protein